MSASTRHDDASGPPSPAALRALDRRDPALGRARRRVAPFPKVPDRSTADSHFHALARAIVYQQLAGAAASTIHDRVRRLTPGSRFPTAAQITELDDASLRGAGLSAGKLRAIRDLSERSLDGRLRLASLARRSNDAILEELVQVRGIGPWTAQIFLMFRLGRLDVTAPADLGLQEGIRRLDGLDERPTPKEVEARAEVWSPLRTVASWVLWRLADGE